MASHNRTPASILEAPRRTFEIVSVSGHPNRAMRRHMVPRRFRNGVAVTAAMFVPKAYQQRARNVPYVKPTDA